MRRLHSPRLLQRRVADGDSIFRQLLEQVAEACVFHRFHNLAQGGEIGRQRRVGGEVGEVFVSQGSPDYNMPEAVWNRIIANSIVWYAILGSDIDIGAIGR